MTKKPEWTDRRRMSYGTLIYSAVTIWLMALIAYLKNITSVIQLIAEGAMWLMATVVLAYLGMRSLPPMFGRKQDVLNNDGDGVEVPDGKSGETVDSRPVRSPRTK